MTVQLGHKILLKLYSKGGYRTVAGLRSRQIEFNLTPIDITDSESTGLWQELLAGGGVKNLRLTGEGVFKDTAADAAIRESFFAGRADKWQVILPDFGTLSGRFILTELAYAGDYQGEVSWRLSLSSANQISFVAL